MYHKSLSRVICVLGALSPPAFATVTIVSMQPSPKTPQTIGASITWTARATDTNNGPLTFQFDIGPPKNQFALVKESRTLT